MVGGKGGGRADMAQAGGPMVDKLTEAIKAVPKVVRELLMGKGSDVRSECTILRPLSRLG